MLYVTEVFTSIQGETTFAGWPSSFIRLSGCNLRCRWCDTRYAYEQGEQREIGELVEAVASGPTLVSVTGGEPLLQEDTPRLLTALADSGHRVIVETNGSLPVDSLDPRCHRIVDLKPPSSGEVGSTLWDNLSYLSARDEVKIVIADRGDFEWAENVVAVRRLPGEISVNFSPAHGMLAPRQLAEWILASGLHVRLNLQLHRLIWPDATQGR